VTVSAHNKHVRMHSVPKCWNVIEKICEHEQQCI